MNQHQEEPPDPRAARLYLLDHFERRSSGQPYDPKIIPVGVIVIKELRDQLQDPIRNAKYAHAVYQLANNCYRGAAGKKQLDEVLTNLAIDIADPNLPQNRAVKLREGLQEMHDLIEK